MLVSLEFAVLESIKLDTVKLQSFLCILENTVTSKPVLIFFTADLLVRTRHVRAKMFTVITVVLLVSSIWHFLSLLLCKDYDVIV